MRRRVTLKSNERSDLFSGQTSKQYSSMGRHLVFTRCRKTSSDADVPSLPNNACTHLLKKERLALSKEHLDLQDCTIKSPKYLILSTQARGVPSAHNIAAHLTSCRCPMRMQQDFLPLHAKAMERSCHRLASVRLSVCDVGEHQGFF